MIPEKFVELKNRLFGQYEEVQRNNGNVDDEKSFMIKMEKDGLSCLLIGVAQQDDCVVLVAFGKISELSCYRNEYQELTQIIEGLGIKWKLG